MRKAFLAIAAATAATVLLAGTAFAQNVANENESTTVIQNHGTSANTGQQGTGTQLDNSDSIDIGSGSTFIESPSNVAVGGTTAQSPGATAVQGNFSIVDGNSAGGNVFDVGEDGAYGADGAVVSGALADGGGVAFGEDFDVNDDFVALGGNGVAAIAAEELVEDGSALVIGDTNSTAAANDGAAAVGVNGNAIVIDDGPDDGNVIGFNNTVAISELDQEYSAPVVAGPSADAFLDDSFNPATGETGDTFNEGFGLRDPDGTLVGSNQAFGTIETGNVGNISASDVAGLNDMFFSTGVGNQGHIASVGANVGPMILN
ncbi:MAG: hypothetical protein WDZ84_04250 [Rhodovibrionaceae bacterium]